MDKLLPSIYFQYLEITHSGLQPLVDALAMAIYFSYISVNLFPYIVVPHISAIKFVHLVISPLFSELYLHLVKFFVDNC